MSNPYAVVGLTYDGQDIQQADFTIYFWIVSGLIETPTVRGVDTVVPALAGRVEGNRVNDVLPIVLEGAVMADPSLTDLSAMRADWRTNVRAIRSLFASNRARADLVATLEDGDVLTISARPMNIVQLRSVEGEYVGLNIELEGYDDWAVVAGS